ncbi:hypothetical protein EG328_004929 [Venturia inaequalis]|uniref:Uncharacterized protein n=1 Tax=Venturia inaequalis TaxID=5025 RepID=A0A8H3UNL7_VENIN|nr:hypothetical protein EG328_004929 [Venturia inaequalis]RDI78086.1 hypothetical protein Vi05172_g12003 [Venturia inaequalis]
MECWIQLSLLGDVCFLRSERAKRSCCGDGERVSRGDENGNGGLSEVSAAAGGDMNMGVGGRSDCWVLVGWRVVGWRAGIADKGTMAEENWKQMWMRRTSGRVGKGNGRRVDTAEARQIRSDQDEDEVEKCRAREDHAKLKETGRGRVLDVSWPASGRAGWQGRWLSAV